MRKILFFFCLVFVLSCNKERRLNKDLQGTWEVDMVKLQDADGFSFFDYNPTGNLSISETSVQGEITSMFQSFQGSVSDTLALQGSYLLKLNESELNWVQTPDTIKNRIFVITNKNLEIEHYDAQAQQRLRYVFVKRK
ncbi:MAG: hypothetical protein RLZZ198_1981 [Bacteroidota bacterium]|jgi:hypothetical protein